MRDYVVVSSRFPDLFEELTQIFKADKQIEVVMTEKRKDDKPSLQNASEINNCNVFQKNT
jgi:hypothetical protein